MAVLSARVNQFGPAVAPGTAPGDVPIWTGSGWSNAPAASVGGPEAYGLLEWNIPLPETNGGTIAVAGTKYVIKIVPRISRNINNIELYVLGAGVTLTAAQNLVCLFNGAGTKLGTDSASQDVTWTSVGRKTMAIGGPIAVVAGQTYYVEILSNGTTPPIFNKGPANAGAANYGLSAAASWVATNGTGATATDASITPSALTVTGGTLIQYWVGLS